MNRPTFWKLIDTVKVRSAGDPFQQTELLSEALQQLTAQEILGFDKVFAELQAESFRSDLWAAAYLIQGGCSDDGFDYFRCWLIAQGQRVFENALANPETLADVMDYDEDEREEVVDAVGDDMIGIAWRAYEAKTGQPMPAQRVQQTLQGPQWDEDDLPTLFPKLHARFG